MGDGTSSQVGIRSNSIQGHLFIILGRSEARALGFVIIDIILVCHQLVSSLFDLKSIFLCIFTY